MEFNKKIYLWGFVKMGFVWVHNIMYPYQTHNFYTILGPVAD